MAYNNATFISTLTGVQVSGGRSSASGSRSPGHWYSAPLCCTWLSLASLRGSSSCVLGIAYNFLEPVATWDIVYSWRKAGARHMSRLSSSHSRGPTGQSKPQGQGQSQMIQSISVPLWYHGKRVGENATTRGEELRPRPIWVELQSTNLIKLQVSNLNFYFCLCEFKQI